jgi:hypothetical protein
VCVCGLRRPPKGQAPPPPPPPWRLVLPLRYGARGRALCSVLSLLAKRPSPPERAEGQAKRRGILASPIQRPLPFNEQRNHVNAPGVRCVTSCRCCCRFPDAGGALSSSSSSPPPELAEGPTACWTPLLRALGRPFGILLPYILASADDDPSSRRRPLSSSSCSSPSSSSLPLAAQQQQLLLLQLQLQQR